MDFPAELHKLGSEALGRRAVEPVIALVCLSLTATFVEPADKVDSTHQMLYAVCVVLAVTTAGIGLGGLGLHFYRVLWRTDVQPASGKAASD